MKRTILIGIDGASHSLLKDFITSGVMPNLKRLASQGVLCRMTAPLPDNSAVSWSSIMTGKNPGEHGIFGFTDIIPHTYTMHFPNFLSLETETFWQREPDKKHVIINLPFTYPVQSMNGYMVSGFVSPNIEKSVYPEQFLDYLKKTDYQIDADTRKIYQSKQMFLNSLFQVHKNRVQVYRTIWDDVDWDVFMVVFTGTDRLGHYFQDVLDQKDSEYYDSYLQYYRMIDEEIGWISDQKDDNDIMVMMSDHGMERIAAEVNLNTYLEQNGFLDLSKSERINYNNITDKTRAFVLEPARIHLNYASQYPNGKITKHDREPIIRDLTDLFKDLTYPESNKKVISEVVRKEEIYTGDQMEHAPDLLLVSHKGFSLRGTLGKDEMFSHPDIIKGMHRGNDAFLYVHGSEAADVMPEIPRTEDILHLVNTLKGE